MSKKSIDLKHEIIDTMRNLRDSDPELKTERINRLSFVERTHTLQKIITKQKIQQNVKLFCKKLLRLSPQRYPTIFDVKNE